MVLNAFRKEGGNYEKDTEVISLNIEISKADLKDLRLEEKYLRATHDYDMENVFKLLDQIQEKTNSNADY